MSTVILAKGDPVTVRCGNDKPRGGTITGESRDKRCWYVRPTVNLRNPKKPPTGSTAYHKSFVHPRTQTTP